MVSKLVVSFLLFVSTALAQNGLLAHWSFDSASQDVHYDMTGNGYSAHSSGLGITEGIKGNALHCDNTNFDVTISNSVGNFELPTFTIEGWINSRVSLVNPGSGDNFTHIFDYLRAGPSGSGDAGGFVLQITDAGKLEFALSNPSGKPVWIFLTSDYALQPNRWYYVAATYDGSAMRLFTDGKLVNERNHSTGYRPSNIPARIGCHYHVTTETDGFVMNRFRGAIDEVKLYNYALSKSEVSAHYDSLKPTTAPRLLAHWSFDSTANRTYYDITQNGFDAITTKGTTSVIEGLMGKSLNCTSDSFLTVIQNSRTVFNVPQFTLEGWIYSYVDLVNPGSFFNSHHIFTTQTWIPSGKAEGFEISVDDHGRFHLAMASASGDSWVICTSDSVLKPRRWYHVAGTYDSQNMKVYLNGRLAGSRSHSSGYALSQSDAVIGCQMPADSSQWRNWFKGKIDELKFYNYALDAQSILGSYHELKPIDEPPFEINFGMKTTFAQPGDTVIMPIYITNYEDFAINACQFTMNFSSNCVDLVSIEKDSGIISSWPLFNWNPITAGSVSIAMAGTSTPVTYGEGEFVRCIFRVKPVAVTNDTCTITLHNISIDETYNLITATTKSGKIIINNADILHGDVTGNGEVNLFDAQKVLSYVVGNLTLPDSVCCPNFTLAVADVSGNGAITSYDAALIFQHSVGLLPEFPVTRNIQQRLQKSSVSIPSIAQISTRIENSTNNELRCTIIGSNLKGFVAGEFSIGFDPSVVALSRGLITTTVRGATLHSKVDTTSKLLKVAMVTNDHIDGNDPVTLLNITLPPVHGNLEAVFSILGASINEGKIPTNIVTTAVQLNRDQLRAQENRGLKVEMRNKALTIKTYGKGTALEARVWTINGKLILMENLNTHSTTNALPLTSLPAGSYFFRVRSGNTVQSGRFVIVQ